MLCPYCLEDTPKAATCAACKVPLPPLYVQSYNRFRPPAVLSIVGFSVHGKTVYLASLLHSLESKLTRVWPNFYRQGLDQKTILTVKENLKLLENGELPPSTLQNFPDPSLHLLAKMPVFKDRQIAAYDTSGEAFEDDLRMERHASFVKHARSVLFLVSLVNLEEPLAVDLQRLLETYTLGMSRMKAKTKKQHLVVVYTKSDLLISERFLGKSPFLVEYLQSNEDHQIGDIKRYLGQMGIVSQELHQFTEENIGARGFTHLARSSFKSVSYCAVSALGSPPADGNKLSEAMQPRRVIDPLLWVLQNA